MGGRTKSGPDTRDLHTSEVPKYRGWERGGKGGDLDYHAKKTGKSLGSKFQAMNTPDRSAAEMEEGGSYNGGLHKCCKFE